MAGSSPGEYIKHHLGNLTYGKLPEGYVRECDGRETLTLTESTWAFACNGNEAKDMGFTAFHVDSLAWSGGLGIIMCLLFWMGARKATAGVPSGFMNFIETMRRADEPFEAIYAKVMSESAPVFALCRP